ncbi:MAG: hypothetical protein ACPGC9_00815 [Cytophagales bacterium]
MSDITLNQIALIFFLRVTLVLGLCDQLMATLDLLLLGYTPLPKLAHYNTYTFSQMLRTMLPS